MLCLLSSASEAPSQLPAQQQSFQLISLDVGETMIVIDGELRKFQRNLRAMEGEP